MLQIILDTRVSIFHKGSVSCRLRTKRQGKSNLSFHVDGFEKVRKVLPVTAWCSLPALMPDLFTTPSAQSMAGESSRDSLPLTGW